MIILPPMITGGRFVSTSTRCRSLLSRTVKDCLACVLRASRLGAAEAVGV